MSSIYSTGYGTLASGLVLRTPIMTRKHCMQSLRYKAFFQDFSKCKEPESR
jgi:hypothetical protein